MPSDAMEYHLMPCDANWCQSIIIKKLFKSKHGLLNLNLYLNYILNLNVSVKLKTEKLGVTTFSINLLKRFKLILLDFTIKGGAKLIQVQNTFLFFSKHYF